LLPTSTDFRGDYHLLQAISLIRKISDIQADVSVGCTVFHEMHRLAQQQFPWQKPIYFKLSRLHRIYRDTALSAVLESRTGLTISEYYLMGMATAGNFLTHPAIQLSREYTAVGISNSKRDAFLRLITFTLPELKQRTLETQEYNHNWSYTINPLRSTPLLIPTENPGIAICPIPAYLLERISDGIFFDVYSTPGFENAYGDAYENYVGEISKELSTPNLEITKPKKYLTKKQEKRGADWIIFDKNSVLLIEAKAKRMSLGARYQFETSAIERELELMSKFLVQNYKNLVDIQDNLTGFQLQGRKIYPVIVTLFDWHLFSPQTREKLNKLLTTKLAKSGIPNSILSSNPFTIMPIDELESSIQIMNTTGIEKCMSLKCNSTHQDWQMHPFLSSAFREESNQLKYDYLKYELNSIIHGAEDQAGLPRTAPNILDGAAP
ncbi:TPA: hypothetical protein ACJX8E_005964, partial [Pseudomonas aeruginosa]